VRTTEARTETTYWGRDKRRRPLGSLVLAGVLVVLVLLGLGKVTGFLPDLKNPFGTDEVDRSQPAVLQALEDVSRYQAATGNFSVLVDLEDDARFLPDFLQGRRTVFAAVGSVDATVDFSGLTDEAIEISPDGTSVRITLPPAVLSDPRVDPEQSRVVSQDRGLRDRIGSVFTDTPPGERELYLLAEDDLRDAAAASDLKARAEANTRQFLETLLRSLGFTDVTVVFGPAPQNSDVRR
jgi:hypothetical protein